MVTLRKMLIQTALLLMFGQVLLGAVGYAAVSAGLPWAGLPLLLLYGWLILRTARVLHTALQDQVRENRTPLEAWRYSLLTLLVWQVPGVLVLALHNRLPDWLPRLWHGLNFPMAGTVSWLVPGLLTDMLYWHVGVIGFAAGLFMAVAGRPLDLPMAPKPVAARPSLATAAGGEWAPARRAKDVATRRGRRIK